ncbi:MAG: LptF/LptG family permease, partial [Candidatus Competibacteraceae bacterium]|nr:LptF/LptG family permease [Candidatus Competibacteraceae bacterium]
MLTIVDRYLLREVALTFSATVTVLLAMVLSYRLARYLSQATQGLLAQDAIWSLLGLQAVRFLVILIPLASLIAIMLALGR